jgi:ABC-type transport system involved in cytochrome c biogenesis permease component
MSIKPDHRSPVGSRFDHRHSQALRLVDSCVLIPLILPVMGFAVSCCYADEILPRILHLQIIIQVLILIFSDQTAVDA